MIIPISYFNLNDGRNINIVTRVQNLYSNGETSVTVTELEKSYTNTPESQLQMIQDVLHYFELVGNTPTVATAPTPATPAPAPATPAPATPAPATVSQPQVGNPDKSPYSLSVAAILCFFLGHLGIHRFYTGRGGSGMSMLMLSIINIFVLLLNFTIPFGYQFYPFAMISGLVCGIWALVDFIVILCGEFKDGEGKTLMY